MDCSSHTSGLIVAVVVAVASTACSTLLPDMPRTGVVANGQPLVIREARVTELERYEDKVATVRDDSGRTLADVYERGIRVNHIPVWYGYQGTEYVDADDFFRIAGDQESRGHVRRTRTLAYVANRGGWIATVVGIGLIIASAALSEDTPGRTGIFVSGLVGFGAGPPIALWGAKHLAPERHGVSSLSAAMAAAQYNEGLRDTDRGDTGTTVRVNAGWNF